MIRNWPTKSRPRERLINEGAKVLSDAELLAIILRTGTRGKSVVQLAQELLNHFGDMRALLACELGELQLIKGLGPAKFAQISAVKEIAQRCLIEQLGLLVLAIRPPTVPKNTARLRITLCSEHTRKQIDLLASALLEIENSLT